MGKVLGIISLVCGLISFGISPLSYFAVPLFMRFFLLFTTPLLAGTGIVCGGIGIAKDDSKGLAIAGLVISSIAMINFFVGSFTSFWGLTY